MEAQDHPRTLTKLSEFVADYSMPVLAQKLLKSTDPLIICGITAAGKDTLIHELMQDGGYNKVISHTTRLPRSNHGVLEQNGKDYHFVDEKQMLKLVLAKAFVEVKQVHSNFYGTSLEALKLPLQHNDRPILEIDVQGVEEFLQAVPTLKPVFLLPPSFTVWQERLKGRGVIDNDDKISRFNSALKEIETVQQNPSFQLLVNQDKTQSAHMIQRDLMSRPTEAFKVADELTEAIISWLARAS